MRPIDADDLYARIEKMLKRAENFGDDREMFAYQDCQYAIEKAPTIDPVKRGKWEMDPPRGTV